MCNMLNPCSSACLNSLKQTVSLQAHWSHNLTTGPKRKRFILWRAGMCSGSVMTVSLRQLRPSDGATRKDGVTKIIKIKEEQEYPLRTKVLDDTTIFLRQNKTGLMIHLLKYCTAVCNNRRQDSTTRESFHGGNWLMFRDSDHEVNSRNKAFMVQSNQPPHWTL